MNIWIVNNYAIPPIYGGLVRHFYFAHYLQEMGHRVRILTDSQIHNTRVNVRDPGKFLKEVTYSDVLYTYVACASYEKNDWRRIYNMLQFTFYTKKAMEILYQGGDQPDIIYASSPLPSSSYSAMKFAKKHKIPFIFEERDLWPLSLEEYGKIGSFSPLRLILQGFYGIEHRLHRESAASLFTIAGGRDYIQDKNWTDVALEKIYHINNGVDLAEFDQNRESYPYLDPDLDDPLTFKVVYTGSIRSIYDLDVILEAAKLLQAEDPEVTFLFYGEGPERCRLEKRVQEEKITNARFKGRVDKKFIPSILSRADLCLIHHHPVGLMRYGSSNNKLFEYLASANPVLSTVPSSYSIVREKQCGLECPDQEPETIAQTLLTMKNWSPEKRKKVEKNARLAVQEYDFSRLSQKLEKIFIKALS